MAKTSDKDISLLKARDAVFLKQVFTEANPFLFKILASNRIFKEAAEEIVQETWHQFFEKIDQFEGRSQIKTFVCGILINKLREHRRFYKKMNSEEDSEKIYAQSFTEDGWWITPPADPHKLMQSAEMLKYIDECLESLSEEQREAFSLREIDQEKSDNICKILDVTVSHLGVLIFRAKEKLRLCIEGKVEVEFS